MVRTGLIWGVLVLSVVWTTSGQRQRQRQCPRLQKPWNGQIISSCNRYVGSECVFQCRDPYILVGSRVRVCRSDGTWSGSTTACELDACSNCGGGSNCANLYDPANGYTRGQCTPGIVGQSCQFYCNSGYSLDGQSHLTCLNGGHWNFAAPMCRHTTAAMCEDIIVQNGYVTCTTEGGLTVCRVTCYEGYMIVGSSVVTCSSGAWGDQIPICRRSGITETTNVCPTLVTPNGGRLVGSCTSANSGDTCQLVCLSGYRPTDTRVLICLPNGRWSDTLPNCVGDSVGCPSISVSQGSTSGTCTPGVNGQICTITCNSGYTLTGGSGTLVCQSNGQWSGNIPSCSAQTCPALPSPVSGGYTGTCSPGQQGQTCNFYCNSGYQLVGQSTLICGSDGRWSGNSPYCAGAACPNLNVPTNGARSGSCTQATVGESCSFSCQAGYALNGQSTLYCQSGGTWSSSPPTCTRRQTCPTLNPPANGLANGVCSQASVGQTCTFSCLSGYTLNGQSTVYCQEGGRWSSGTPACIPNTPSACGSLVAPNNGFMIGTCAPGRVGETCVFGCDDQYVLRGQRTLSCLSNGQWSDATPRCERSGTTTEGGNCPVLTPPPNGDFLQCDNRPGGQCVVVCDRGYVRSGSRVRTCLGQGSWSGYAPTCTRTGCCS